MIQRVFSLLIILSLQLLATQYNSTILEIEAKIFPKMILMSEDIDKKSESLEIYVIAREIDTDSAERFKAMIESNYTNKLSGKKINVSIKKFHHFKTTPDAVIVLYHNDKQLKKIALWANENKIISLGYDPVYMRQGILASIYIGKSTKPYLNKAIIEKYKFRFNPYLLKLSKFH